MWVPWRLERSPLAPAVPLEGSDTVEGLQALERRRLTEALSGGAAVGAAAAGRAGAAATGRRAFQRYRGPFIDQLSIEDLKAAPKSWALFWRGGERASAADAYSLPASLAVLHERTEASRGGREGLHTGLCVLPILTKFSLLLQNKSTLTVASAPASGCRRTLCPSCPTTCAWRAPSCWPPFTCG